MSQGVTIWLTGLVGSGKSTLARALAEKLLSRGCMVEVLASGPLRQKLSPELGFTPDERDCHTARLAFLAKLLTRNGVVTIVDAVAPSGESRARARYEIGELVEVYLDTPLEVCRARDGRDLYARAEQGRLPDFPGVSLAYEPPGFPELTVNPAEMPAEACAMQVLELLEELQYLAPLDSGSYSPEDEEKVRRRLEDLGYI